MYTIIPPPLSMDLFLSQFLGYFLSWKSRLIHGMLFVVEIIPSHTSLASLVTPAGDVGCLIIELKICTLKTMLFNI